VATNAEIQTAIDDATAAAVTPPQMVLILDRAIAAAYVDAGGLAVVSYATGTRSRTISVADAMALRKYYAGLGSSGSGFRFIGVEFQS